MSEPRTIRPAVPEPSPTAVSLATATRVWLRIGLTGFGGPAGQIAQMHRIVVEEKGWVDEARFLHALNYCMLLPGPEAQQLATYLGWLLHGSRGGLIAGTLFVLPGAVIILALSVLYAGFHDLTFIQALFYGIKAVVLAVVIEALIRIGRRALKTWFHGVLAGLAFVAIFVFAVPFPLIVLAAAALGLSSDRLAPRLPGRKSPATDTGPAHPLQAAVGRTPAQALRLIGLCLALWFAPTAAAALLLGNDHVLVDIGLFFSVMAVVTFGGAYAVLAYVAQEAVATYGWLGPGEMLNGLGLAETTPGPLILVLQFVAFLAAHRHPDPFAPYATGVLGAVLCTWVTFVPCFLWIFLGAPHIERLRSRASLNAMLAAITAAVVGVVLNLSLWFALHVVFARVEETRVGVLRLYVPNWASLDVVALGLATAAMVAMLRFRVGMIPTLAAGAALGAAAFYLFP